MSNQENNTIHKYPSGFRYGCAFGVFVQICTRVATKEPMAARPFSYLTVALGYGAFMSYYDWWRRCAIDEIMVVEKERNYHNTIKGMNNVRVGEEDETQNLVEYLTGTTSRL